MAHLCGLCLALRADHGQLARVATNYDGLIVSVLTEAQTGPAAGARRTAGPCPLRAMRTAPVARGEGRPARRGRLLVLASAKVRDHVADGDGLLARRPLAAAARGVARRWDRAGSRAGRELGLDTAVLLDAVGRQSAVEALAGPGTPLLTVTEPTETATAAAFAHTAVLAGKPHNAAPLAEARPPLRPPRPTCSTPSRTGRPTGRRACGTRWRPPEPRSPRPGGSPTTPSTASASPSGTSTSPTAGSPTGCSPTSCTARWTGPSARRPAPTRAAMARPARRPASARPGYGTPPGFGGDQHPPLRKPPRGFLAGCAAFAFPVLHVPTVLRRGVRGGRGPGRRGRAAAGTATAGAARAAATAAAAPATDADPVRCPI